MITTRDGAGYQGRIVACALLVMACISVLLLPHDLHAFALNVTDISGNPVYGYRWLVEEDTTNITVPKAAVSNSISVDIHKSYAPVIYKGNSLSSSTTVDVPADKPYIVSVLPLDGYAMSGTTVAVGQGAADVVVHLQPIYTAQITVYVFNDSYPINNAPDVGTETGLPGFSILIFDLLGQVSQDAFGKPLGTTYKKDGSGEFIIGPDGMPVVDTLGSGVIVTDSGGNADIKYLAPGKYGIRAVPPPGPSGVGWVQTATIEGTPGVDAWVKANEPPLFVEGFGTGFKHVFIGFVKPSTLPWATSPPAGTGTITGALVNNHFSRPPRIQGFFAGEAVSGGWVGINDPVTGQGLYAVACDPGDGTFTISDVLPGAYQLVTWDEPLDTLFGFNTVTVPPGIGGTGGDLALGNVLTYRWFGTLEGRVFYDSNQNGFRDVGEVGLTDQAVNLRFRDGSIYQATVTEPPDGEYSFAEVFPFFKWLIAEVDFARYKATGMTSIVDYGGQVLPDNGWTWPSRGRLYPQPQAAVNPNTGNSLSRTETGEVLLQAMMLFLGQTNVIEWGKVNYAAEENGGISGIVYYATTRAEDDPRYAVGDAWEPGIPRVQVNLYYDKNDDGVIDDANGDGVVTLADVDNYPFGWAEGGAQGAEDIDRNYPGQAPGAFDMGDSIQLVTSDSWDDNMPTGSIYENIPVVHGQQVKNGFDGFGTWNQVRPGVFDGGYAFADVGKDTYIVEAVPPPGYELVKEEDKNVFSGDSYTPSKLAAGGVKGALPPVCVGDNHTVPDQSSLFPGTPPFAGQTRPLCNRKQIKVFDGLNAAVDFFFFTEVPKAARAVGFVNNDLSAEFNVASPVYGEKAAPAWLPVSIKDWSGRELVRVYTDEWGGYNALIPSTFTVNVPIPTGVSPNMLTLVLNDPFLPNGVLDDSYDPNYTVTPWTFDFWPGKVTYLDTPIVPIAAFVTNPFGIVDAQPANGTPVIDSVIGTDIGVSNDGPYAGVAGAGHTVTITSPGTAVSVPNPDYDPTTPGSQPTITRDYGFGATQGTGTVSIGGVTLTGIISWGPTSITATVQAGVTTGQLVVTRGDNGMASEMAVTFHVGAAGGSVLHVPADYATIQAAIDDAAINDLILVAPGTYDQNPIMYKKVRLQGSGRTTKIFANPNPPDALAAWHTKMLAILAVSDPADQFKANNPVKEAPGVMVLGNYPGFVFDATPPTALIDGFYINGSLSGGGIYVNNDAASLTVSNNMITGNQGNEAGGVTLGTSHLGLSSNNDNVTVQYNRIAQNGGVQGAGGVGIYEGADTYTVQHNVIVGNFSRFSGGGIAHVGLSTPGLIAQNKIMFNEVFYGALLAGAGDGGGIYVAGDAVPGALSAGAGSVTIDRNLIQGNIAGAGSGGGIRAYSVNGQDVADNPGAPANWHSLHIYNNIIVNNVAGYAAGGIALQDVAGLRLDPAGSKLNIVNNTIANNDSTATAAAAFSAGNPTTSNPQGAGIVANAHSQLLQDALTTAGSPEEFPDAAIRDSIIWHNRSFSWDGTLGGNVGGLVPSPASPNYSDLTVTGTTAPQSLTSQNCVLTLTAGNPNFGNAGGTILSYVNTLYSAAVLDEGGNSISVRFSPVKESAGDYHIRAGSNAIGVGGVTHPSTDYQETDVDYDGASRPAVNPDAGADQI